ncbi:pyridoxal kinase, partial [Bacillus vallismortis]|nr:pyridoxal kinase [Bacillus vallismortis]
MSMHKELTIACSYSSCGDGIQSDLNTLQVK